MSTDFRVRFAEPRDAASIWSLYQRTGFLYPEKLTAMGDGGREARAIFERLLLLPPQEYGIILCETEDGALRSACTCGRFSDAQSWIQHLVSDSDRRALMHALVATGNGAIQSSASWFGYTFRENNSSVRRLFTSPLARLKEGGWSVELASHDFYTIPVAPARRLQEIGAGSRAQIATERDRRAVLEQLGDPSQQAALAAQGSFTDGCGVADLAGRLAQIGLRRQRAAFVVEAEGQPAGLAVADIAPAWWNLSNLSTGVAIWQTGGGREVAAALLSRAAGWFAERSLESWTLLVGDGQEPLRQVLAEAGLTSNRRYLRLTGPMEALPLINAAYARFIGRSTEPPRVLQYDEVHGARGLERAA
jgi:hypothetical protein